MSNLPIFQSPYQRQIEIMQDRKHESDAFFRMNALTFEEKMQKIREPESIELFVTVKKRGQGEKTEIVTIRANEISGRWSMDPTKTYEIPNPETQFFIQAKSYQWCLDQYTLKYTQFLRDEFKEWIMTSSWPRFRHLKAAPEYHPWLMRVCTLTAEEAILMHVYDRWMETGESNFIDNDMKQKIADLLARRSQVGTLARANNWTFKHQGLGAKARKFLEESIINDQNSTQAQKELKLQKVLEDRTKILRNSSGLIQSSQARAIDRMNKNLQENESRWRLEQQLRLLEGSDDE